MAIIKDFKHDGKNYALLEHRDLELNLHSIALGEYDRQDLRKNKIRGTLSFLIAVFPYVILLVASVIGLGLLITSSSSASSLMVSIFLVFIFAITIAVVIHQLQFMEDIYFGDALRYFIDTRSKEGQMHQAFYECDNTVELLINMRKTGAINYIKQLPVKELDKLLVDSIDFSTKTNKLRTLKDSLINNAGDEFLRNDVQKKINELNKEISQLEQVKKENSDKMANSLNNDKMLNALAS